jgi:hypothetical protein
MFLKCHYLLHPLAKFEYLPNKMNDKDCNLNIFKIIFKTSEPTKKLVIVKFLIFQHYQEDVKDIRCPLQWVKHKSMFLIVVFQT